MGVYMDGVQRGVDVYNGVYRGMWFYIWGSVQRDVGVY